MEQDPLIANGWETVVQITTTALLIGVVTLIGFFSRKLEGALFFTILAGGSLIVMVLLLFIGSQLNLFA